MQTEWDAEQEVEFDPPKDKVFVGGSVKPPKKPAKCGQKVNFSFASKRLDELKKLSEEGEMVSAGAGFFDLGKQYDRGEGVDGGKCIKKAFQCYQAALREGYLSALHLLQNRTRSSDDQDSIERASGIYIPLYDTSSVERANDDPKPTEQIFIGADPNAPCFPFVNPEDFQPRW